MIIRLLPVQGPAADVMKLALVGIGKALGSSGATLLATIHDSVLVESPDDREALVEVARILEEQMAAQMNALCPAVRCEVETKAGATWADVVPLDKPAPRLSV